MTSYSFGKMPLYVLNYNKKGLFMFVHDVERSTENVENIEKI